MSKIGTMPSKKAQKPSFFFLFFELHPKTSAIVCWLNRGMGAKFRSALRVGILPPSRTHPPAFLPVCPFHAKHKPFLKGQLGKVRADKR